ncbi:CCA tRNA nucleotidyltransferase [Sphingomonas parva]|uniref:CCA tRNA nucleotidyltransferase n=1 Tax=Sphingomonas parva TaxID=2555898 RepID=A0A4Y8ZPX9_9SPHN|nr:CCA tRNA nucleotidyltransferase [Sphingomonas parva]TFI58070.1 CCA tRNA nucleotidyltransferase [Sphingomonas parva]
MKLPDVTTTAALRRLLDTLGAREGETRYVGGWVRDTLLGVPVSDLDLATRLRPDEVLARLRRAGIKAVPTGLAHGTITAIVEGRPVEVTTLRRDVSTDGRRATIAYTDDWKEDAARRDFTINALSADPQTGDVHDYFDGEGDLAAGRVRFIGEPLKRIAEDHLRILRFFRFHARFGRGPAEPEGLAACVARANDLMALSRERIADEVLKLLALPAPCGAVRLMIDGGILRPVLPEISDAEPLEALIAREAEAGLAADPLRRLAALLPANAEVAASVAARLRLSNKAAKRLASAARRSAADAGEPAQRLAYRLGRDEAVDRILLGSGDAADAASLESWQRPRLSLGGGDLIAMGLRPGPVVAATLQALERSWAEAGFPAEAETQQALARTLVDQALRASQ